MTSQAKIENSALGSWAGYIYQGLCGIYHVLSLLLQDEQKYADHILNLDSYEDFSILDGCKKIVSLHQCKDEKRIKEYKSEQQKMVDKKNYLIEQGLTDCNCQVFFHNAHDIVLNSSIKLYNYHNKKSYCKASEILNLISELIEKFPSIKGSNTCILQSLCFIVESKVLDVQKKYFDSSNTKLRDLARSESEIPFQSIIDIIETPSYLSIDVSKIPNYVRSKYVLKLNEILSDEIDSGFEVDVDKIDHFINRLTLLSEQEILQLVQRINPHQDCSILNDDFLLSICSDERIESLYRQIQELDLLSENLDWQTAKSRQTPTTLISTSPRENMRLCKRIYEMSPNLNCLWEYDWLVGNIHSKVDSIFQACNITTATGSEENSNNIFLQKKVGILTIEEKKNGSFE